VKALEKIVMNTDWVTIFLVVLLMGFFFLKALDAKKLKGYAFAFFNKGFVEDESKENTPFLKVFQSIIFMFSILVLSLISYFVLIDFSENKNDDFYLFLLSFVVLFFYFLIKWALEYLLSVLFLIQNDVRFFLASKSIYLYSVCFYLFITLVLVQYTQLNSFFLMVVSMLFFLVRFFFHITNNKKLVFNKLFYFILYFCAFEIAPLFILFKMIFLTQNESL
jgi:hypothetical protein